MRDRENVLGQCLGDEVKNLAKTSWKHRVVSMVLFVSGLNTKNVWIKGDSQLDKSAMSKMENVLPTVCGCFCL